MTLPMTYELNGDLELQSGPDVLHAGMVKGISVP